mmetsp:Transcript_4794/g.10658  ORF Transcript_4794/g.10658 Transcript_4794/m.10658 type:complete len:784 (-) Transcript_4794:145-2496(-)
MNSSPAPKRANGGDTATSPSTPSPPPKKIIKARAGDSPLSDHDRDPNPEEKAVDPTHAADKAEEGEGEEEKNDPLRTIEIEEIGDDEEMQTIDLPDRGPALVFGASCAQGRAVIEGLTEHGYGPIYGATRDIKTCDARYAQDVLDVTLVQLDLTDVQALEKVLSETRATSIFLVSTTDMPTGNGDRADFGFQSAEDVECDTIKTFFDTLVKVFKADGLSRHVVFSALDNVKSICYSGGGDPWIEPLEDGSICPHYSAKGRAGEYAMELLKDINGLTLTLLTLPFFHSNFLGFATPLPNEGNTQWTISACFGDNSAIDMLSVSDLSYIVPELFDEPTVYGGRNIRASAERITMEEVADEFSDLFGKDVLYNPLTPKEMAQLPIPAAGCMAQMCQFLGDPRSAHDIEGTASVMFPRKPQLFRDWLLINSDNKAFEEVGLSIDPKELTTVTVFGASGLQGTSVVKGLLTDTRKHYQVRATTRHLDGAHAQVLLAMDPERVTLVQADFESVESCAAAVDGADGAFLATDFFEGASEHVVDEHHARNIIDACEASHTVRHVVFSTMEYIEEINKKLVPDEGEERREEKAGESDRIDIRARAAAYARTKKLSCTFVLMPCYSEMFYKLLMPQLVVDEGTGEERAIMTVPTKGDTKVMCMSVDDLGPAVASIFDSYQVYAGHEIGLVTEFVSVKEMTDILADAYIAQTKGEGDEKSVEMKEIPMERWIEQKDTYMKDFGEMFKYLSHSGAVRKRHSVAKTMKLLPETKPFKKWVEQNKDKTQFRQSLGLR